MEPQRHGASGTAERSRGLSLAQPVPHDEQQNLPLGVGETIEHREDAATSKQSFFRVVVRFPDRRRDTPDQRALATLPSTQIGQHSSCNTKQPRERLVRHIGHTAPCNLEGPRKRLLSQPSVCPGEQIRGDAVEMLPV
jgi:hypothetical protein